MLHYNLFYLFIHFIENLQNFVLFGNKRKNVWRPAVYMPSSPSKPVPGGSKIVGKREREKREKVRIMTDLWSFSIASALATWTIIFMTASSPCEQKHTLGCPFAAMDSYRHFSLHHEIQFDLVERISTRSTPHRKRLAKVEAIPFPTSKHFQSTA